VLGGDCNAATAPSRNAKPKARQPPIEAEVAQPQPWLDDLRLHRALQTDDKLLKMADDDLEQVGLASHPLESSTH